MEKGESQATGCKKELKLPAQASTQRRKLRETKGGRDQRKEEKKATNRVVNKAELVEQYYSRKRKPPGEMRAKRLAWWFERDSGGGSRIEQTQKINEVKMPVQKSSRSTKSQHSTGKISWSGLVGGEKLLESGKNHTRTLQTWSTNGT